MKLHDLVHGRAGDKGDTSNVSIIAYHGEDFDRLLRDVTAERVAAYLNQPASAVARFVLPQLCAMNFVIRGALKGGVTRSLSLDAHGKCLSSVLLNMSLPSENR